MGGFVFDEDLRVRLRSAAKHKRVAAAASTPLCERAAQAARARQGEAQARKRRTHVTRGGPHDGSHIGGDDGGGGKGRRRSEGGKAREEREERGMRTEEASAPQLPIERGDDEGGQRKKRERESCCSERARSPKGRCARSKREEKGKAATRKGTTTRAHKRRGGGREDTEGARESGAPFRSPLAAPHAPSPSPRSLKSSSPFLVVPSPPLSF